MLGKATKYYLHSYKGLTKEIWLLSFVNLINRCGTMVIPFMMLYLTSQQHCTISQAGIVMSLWGIGAFIGSYIGGKLSDSIGFHQVQLMTLALGGVGFIILGFLQNYSTICIFTFILGAVNEAFRPANSAAIGKYSTEKNRVRSLTLMRLSFNLGWALGGGIGGFIAHHSYQLLFWVDGITNISAALLLWKLLPVPKKEITTEKGTISTKKISIWSDKQFIKFILISIIFLSCFVQLFTNLSAYFKQELHYSENLIGFLSSWNGLLIVLMEMTVIYWIERNWSQKKAVIFGVSLHGIAYLIVSFFHLSYFGALVMITFITLSEMLSFSVLVNFWMRRTDDTNRGQYAAVWTMTWAFSQTIGPFAGSLIAQYAGFQILWFFIVFLSCLAMLLYTNVIQNE
jgi:predicted MFS family arabinose efflux permease